MDQRHLQNPLSPSTPISFDTSLLWSLYALKSTARIFLEVSSGFGHRSISHAVIKVQNVNFFPNEHKFTLQKLTCAEINEHLINEVR